MDGDFNSDFLERIISRVVVKGRLLIGVFISVIDKTLSVKAYF